MTKRAMEVLLDTNFVISCILKKIDFVGELEAMGFTPILPKEVLQELKDLKTTKKISHDEKNAIDVAFEIFEKAKIKKDSIGKVNVDEGLIRKGKKGIYIATLDARIKREISNKVVIDGAKRKLKVERD